MKTDWRRGRRVLSCLLLFFSAGALVLSQTHEPAARESGTEGERLYNQYCAQCHGVDGDGMGTSAPYLKPKPRDFTTGKYKIRSTPTGTLPTDEDLATIIREGMPYTGMPPWPEFNDGELNRLVEHVKTFYSGFQQSGQNVASMDLPDPPDFSEESAQAGKVVYEELGCARCHGDQGRGDGPSAPTLTDDWGFHIRPADLTKPWTYRGGSTRADVYRTFMTGINGTPMPSYADEGALPPENRWPLVDYVYSLSGGQEDPQYANLVVGVGAPAEISLEQGLALFEGAPMARFPVVGQIIEPGRNFYPLLTSIEVRAVYDLENIAILVQWSDMKADVEGENSPLLQADLFDPEQAMDFEQMAAPQQGSQPEAEEDPFAQDPFAEDPFAEETSEGDPFAEAAPDQPTEQVLEEQPAQLNQRSEFSDAVALQFPRELTEGVQKPYFIFGDLERAAELWFVDLGPGGAELFTARGSQAIVAGEGEPFEVASQYKDGRWSVIFTRERFSNRSISFGSEMFIPIAFTVWDGFNRERGNKRTLTNWFHLYLQPLDQPSPLGPMLTRALPVLAGLILVVVLVRRKHVPSLRNEHSKEESSE